MSGETCPLKATAVGQVGEHWEMKLVSYLVPCVLPHGHKGPCSSEPKALGACAETRKAYEELSGE